MTITEISDGFESVFINFFENEIPVGPVGCILFSHQE